jgi:flagellin-like protein
MKANRKFVEGEEAVSAVIGVILMVAITVAIAATVYVYVTGIVPTSSADQENAGVTTSETGENKIKVTLASGGQSYTDGYNMDNIAVFVNGAAVNTLGGTWVVGEGIIIGNSGSLGADDIIATTVASGVSALSAGTYDITVSVLDTVVFDGSQQVV